MAIELEYVYEDALSRNYAEEIDQEDLDSLGMQIVDQVEIDLDSRSEWEEQNDLWMSLAAQFLETKNYPWPNASNVKFPLISTAALQFHARSYPALVNEANLVKIRKHGESSEEKNARANRIQEHMSYQILEEMTEWQEDMDRLLYVLPITGLVYKKVYYSPALRRITAPIILARDVIINYEATSFERATKTHRIYMDANELREYQNLGIYLDVDLGTPQYRQRSESEDTATGMSPSGSQVEDVYTIYECHGWWDFDNDGYKEPYVVTAEKESGKILRIVARFEEDNVQIDDEGNILKIESTEFFVPYKFLPNPESSIYALGFGSLLGPNNAAVNTIINQLIDAGTLATTQGGFLSKQIRIRGGALRFKPGEWKQVQTTGEDLRKGIFPLPVREPSAVLFQLLGLLIQSSKELSSVQDLMTGENPGQNQPHATTMTVLEQGLKVFTGIYKRIYRSLGTEFKRIFDLNKDYLEPETYYELLDGDQFLDKVIAQADYNKADLDVIPGADPTVTSEVHKILRAQSLEAKLAAGFRINPQVVLRTSLEAEGHDNIEELMTVEDQGPPPDVALEMAKFEHQRRLELAQLQLEAQNKRYEAFKDLAQAMAQLAKADATDSSAMQAESKHLMDMIQQEHEMIMAEADKTAEILQNARGTQEELAQTGEMT